jgi:hypothetical protein
MADVRLIIDGEGLPHAKGYYATFPHEPSPAGEMALLDSATVVLSPLTVLNLLDELVKAGPGGTALVVCHAEPHGMRVRLDGGRGTFLSQEAVIVIEESERGLASATSIRAMPEKTDKEKLDKKNAWRSLSEKLDLRIVGDFELDEASRFFDKWFDSQAGRLSISASTLKDVMTKSKAVRALALERLELRACDLGTDKGAMAVIKRFFGCKALLAPRCRTAYLAPMTVESIAPLVPIKTATPQGLPQVSHMPGGVWNAHRLPGPHGLGVLSPDPVTGDLTVKGTKIPGKKRSFFNGRSFLVIGIYETEPFTFTGGAAAPRPVNAVTKKGAPPPSWTNEPDWNQVAEVARSLFMFSGGNYKGKKFPFAGFWDPPASSFPWLVPNEKEYLTLIVSV